MREIMFRGWNKELNNFIYGETILLQEYNNRWVMLVDSELGEEWVYIEEPQQYTCLKDKNGKEIYEGDIVRNCIDHSKYKVSYVAENWTGYVAETLDEAECWYLYEFSELEVIGDIYENSELLQ